MPNVHRTFASLRFHGDDLNPEEISHILSAQPTKCVKKGGIWITPKGTEIVADTCHWSLSAPEESSGDLDKQLTAILSVLSDDLEACRALAARFRGNVFVGLFLAGFNEGLTLSPTTITAIGLRGLALDIDLYSGEDSDGEIV
jgi:hypothetical protein